MAGAARKAEVINGWRPGPFLQSQRSGSSAQAAGGPRGPATALGRPAPADLRRVGDQQHHHVALGDDVEHLRSARQQQAGVEMMTSGHEVLAAGLLIALRWHGRRSEIDASATAARARCPVCAARCPSSGARAAGRRTSPRVPSASVKPTARASSHEGESGRRPMTTCGQAPNKPAGAGVRSGTEACCLRPPQCNGSGLGQTKHDAVNSGMHQLTTRRCTGCPKPATQTWTLACSQEHCVLHNHPCTSSAR